MAGRFHDFVEALQEKDRRYLQPIRQALINFIDHYLPGSRETAHIIAFFVVIFRLGILVTNRAPAPVEVVWELSYESTVHSTFLSETYFLRS